MRLAESFLPPSPKENGFPAISFIQPHIIHFSYLTHMKKTLAAFLLGMALTTSGLTAQTQFSRVCLRRAAVSGRVYLGVHGPRHRGD